MGAIYAVGLIWRRIFKIVFAVGCGIRFLSGQETFQRTHQIDNLAPFRSGRDTHFLSRRLLFRHLQYPLSISVVELACFKFFFREITNKAVEGMDPVATPISTASQFASSL